MNGIGFGALIIMLLVGIQWAMWFDAKKKPEVAAPGQNTTTDKKFVREGV